MPKAQAAKIADSANLIVGGYAMMKHELGFRIVNLIGWCDGCRTQGYS